MNKHSDLPANVIVVDAGYLDFAAGDMRKYFSTRIGRNIEKMNYDSFVLPLLAEAGLNEQNEDILIINIYDEDSAKFDHIVPADLATELNNASAETPFGTVHFMSVTAEGMASRKDFFIEIMAQAALTESVKRIALIPPGNEYDNEIKDVMTQYPDKEYMRFDIVNRQEEKSIRNHTLVYPVMQALGIQADEL